MSLEESSPLREVFGTHDAMASGRETSGAKDVYALGVMIMKDLLGLRGSAVPSYIREATVRSRDNIRRSSTFDFSNLSEAEARRQGLNPKLMRQVSDSSMSRTSHRRYDSDANFGLLGKLHKFAYLCTNPTASQRIGLKDLQSQVAGRIEALGSTPEEVNLAFQRIVE